MLRSKTLPWLGLACGCVWWTGCARPAGDVTPVASTSAPAATVHRIEVGPDAREQAQEAMITCADGDIIEFAEGTFEFDQTLSISGKKRITVRGAGLDKTKLSFKKMGPGTGGEGLKITGSNTELIKKKDVGDAARAAGGAAQTVAFDEGFAHDGAPDDFVISDLTVQDSTSDGIKVEGAFGVVFRNVKSEWTRGPHQDNGAYAIYPVLCDRVLIEGCEARGSSDAGIYVGQSRNVVVRNSKAYENVAGIEIENTVNADVYDNEATGNTGGLLVFSLPGLVMKNGRHSRVFRNNVHDNNIDNFAKPGNVVANIPPGTGMLIMANDQVEVFDNTFEKNMTYNLAVISYLTTGNPLHDPEYDPYPEGIFVHHNRFGTGGDNPQRELGQLAAMALGGKVPDIIYDGWVDDKKLVDGKLPENLRVVIQDNPDADFANIDARSVAEGKTPNMSTDLAPYAGQFERLAEVTGVAPPVSGSAGGGE